MARRSSLYNPSALPRPTALRSAVEDWDPSNKEQWLLDFENEPVNDEKWSCIVTAANANEAKDEKFTLIYADCVATEVRKSVKVINMTTVIKVLRALRSSITMKKDGKLKVRGKSSAAPSVIDLANEYGRFVEDEFVLPPDLMAAVIKQIILDMKNESCYQKRVDAVRWRKYREQNIKARFIQQHKPFEVHEEEETTTDTSSTTIQEFGAPIDDEPTIGPDLYIMLSDFRNPLYFTALLAIKVPLVAFLKISSSPESINNDSNTSAQLGSFWNYLSEQRENLETTSQFKDVIIMRYDVPEDILINNSGEGSGILFDELTWLQYSIGYIQRQYQKYIKQLYVQRLVQSIEPLDLSQCEVYNKLCDVLVTGEPLTPLLVLYAIVEQVVAGVPETKSIVSEFHRSQRERKSSSPLNPCISELFIEKPPVLVPPCEECRRRNVCDKLEEVHSGRREEIVKTAENQSVSTEEILKTKEWQSVSAEEILSAEDTSSDLYQGPPAMPEETISVVTKISIPLIEKVVSERKTEKEIREEKMWKTPKLCFYDDLVFLQSYHCDPRLFNSETIVDRFLKNGFVFQIWKKYPVLPAGEKAFCSFHFFNFRKLSGLTEELLKLKVYFILSMKLIYKIDPPEKEFENIPETGETSIKPPSKVQMDQNLEDSKGRSFSSFFFKTFVIDKFFRVAGKNNISWNDEQQAVESPGMLEGQTGTESALQLTNSTDFEDIVKPQDRVFLTLHSLLDCFEISNLAENRFINRTKISPELIKNFRFYEKLDSNLMIQRFTEAKDRFNAMHCSYFPPTDTLGVILHNDYDYRGIYSTSESTVLPTPVCFRDFYEYVYPEIGTWLIEEEKEHSKFTARIEEKMKEKMEKEDAAFLTQLKRQFCRMNETEREDFLNEELNDSKENLEVKATELGPLLVKPKPNYPNKFSFLTTNFSVFRVENNREITEFHSQDGTQVALTTESWLYYPEKLLKLAIKRSGFSLYYYHYMNEIEFNTDFTFKTDNDIIFSFQKDTLLNYGVTISWPSGLLIKPVPLGSTIYIKQSYLKPYRKGWDIEGENCRCFLDSGRVIIVKDNKDYDILFGSGTRISYYDSATPPKFEIHSTTGEIWQVQTKGACKKRKLIASNKVFIGVDGKTEETFYKREDGVTCMLWPDGTLVTNYPDGTKITTIPEFVVNEVQVDWTESEMFRFSDVETKSKSDMKIKFSLKSNPTLPSFSKPNFTAESFVLISCSYLMEHPKYSRVYFTPYEPYVKVTMQDDLRILMYPEGNYEIQQENEFLSIYNDEVGFYSSCTECRGKSSITLNLGWSDVLCKFVDYFRKAFFVYRDGRTRFEEHYSENDEEFAQARDELCPIGHSLNPCLRRRCFTLERDLSGVEFVHENSLNGYRPPTEDINMDDPTSIGYTFNTPHYKIGYENWVMDYEQDNSSFPTSLKKKDLKEMGVKQVQKNLFKYPFPKHHNCCGNQKKTKSEKTNINEPRVIVARTVCCLSMDPISVITEMKNFVSIYQEKAREIFNAHVRHKGGFDRSHDSRYVKMKLRKIALTLSQSLQMYPHLCTYLPSTEKEIHYFGHFINTWDAIKGEVKDPASIASDCKQIPTRFPRHADFSCIYEESESPHETCKHHK